MFLLRRVVAMMSINLIKKVNISKNVEVLYYINILRNRMNPFSTQHIDAGPASSFPPSHITFIHHISIARIGTYAHM